MSENKNDKPVLLQAVNLVLAKPEDIKKEANSLKEKYLKRYGKTKSEDKIDELVASKIISNYSYYTAFVGGTSALAGVIPGLGTVIASFGGATADATLSMKYQIEMTMAIATVYGHNIELEEEKRLCMIVAGLGAINETAKEAGRKMGTKAFVNLAQKYIESSSAQAVKEIFKNLGVLFSQKALAKSIPFGVGVIIGFSANKGLTWYVGKKAKDFFSFKK